MNGPDLFDRCAVLPQYLLPQRLLTRMVRWATHARIPVWKSWLIRHFIDHYQVDMSSAADSDPARYSHFNSFFTRALRADARPIAPTPNAVSSPVDGYVSEIGTITRDRIVQAKGRDCRLHDLVGGDAGLASEFEQGSFATIYLSPRDYHRVHMPVSGRLRTMIYVPGRLFSVNPRTTRVVPGLFARNERVISIFDTAVGSMAIIMVGALLVGGMETVWAGRVTPAPRRAPRAEVYPASGPSAIELGRGAEMGRFNMGSTVILLFRPGRAHWSDSVVPEARVLMGQEIGQLNL